MNYTLMPIDWDYGCPELNNHLKEYAKRKIFTPFDIEYITSLCGAFNSNRPLNSIITFIKDLKNKWPMIKFGLYQGDTWGELKLMQEF